MSEQGASKQRRLDHNLYTAEGVVVLGAAFFLVGFVIQKSSNNPGRILEAIGFVVFACGLFAVAAISYYLAQHYARATVEPNAPDALSFVDVPRPQFGFLSTRTDPLPGDATDSLERVARAEPENDGAKARLIKTKRLGASDAEPDEHGNQSFNQ